MALRNADRVDVSRRAREGGEEPLLSKQDAAAVRDFLETVRIDNDGAEFRDQCDGSHYVRFFSGPKLLVTLTVHHARSLRWLDGPWSSDAGIDNRNQAAFSEWFLRHGGKFGKLFSSADTTREAQLINEANARFIGRFPAAAQSLLPPEGGMTITTLEPRRIASPLVSLMTANPSLASAAFLALGDLRTSWLNDDGKTGGVQTAVAELSEADFSAGLQSVATDDTALRGAARPYFRFALHRRLSQPFNAEWLPRLADAVMRTGTNRDQPLLLVHLAAADDPAARLFLRQLASGERQYPWSMACEERGDVPQEPSLAAAAALMLAVEREAVAPAPAVPVFGLDAAAGEIAHSLLDPAVPLKPAHFKYRSFTLGYAAAEALARQQPTVISIATLSAGLWHDDYWVVRRVKQVAKNIGLEKFYDGGPYDLSIAPVPETLVAENPALAVQQCTEHLETAKGSTRGALLILRAVAQETLGGAPAAVADYTAALAIPGYPPETIHKRLAWLHWGQGHLAETSHHAELGLQARPDAELFLLRGITKYADDDFSSSADLDFTAALALQPNQGYAEIFQHLCAHLGGRPGTSRLRGKPEYAVPPPATLTIDLARGTLTQADASIPPWPAAIIAFLKDELTSDQLQDRARSGSVAEQLVQTVESHFYIAQKARIAGDLGKERANLQICAAIQIPKLAEYKLATIRLSKLK